MMNERKHAEAYCLMNYECKSCGKREIIWNSRDGVTPCVTRCRYCGGETRHVDYHLDTYDPTFTPTSGMRIFTDMTDEDKVTSMRKRIESFKGTKYYPETEDKYNELLERLVAGLPEGEPISKIIE